MSRPGYRKDDDKRRDRHVSFRCTDAEYARIGETAEHIGTTVSKLARARTIEQVTPRRPPTQGNIAAAGSLNRLTTEMMRIGNNLNQLARQANAGFIDNQFEHRLRAALDELESQKALSRSVIEDLLEGAEVEGDA